jgi:hypothetical protein
MKSTKILLLVFSIFIIVSCQKAGTGGKASLAIDVKHHGKVIGGATVYIKYNSNDAASSIAEYDATFTAKSSGEKKGHAHIYDLKAGKYYLYATGIDTINGIPTPVKGGVPVTIKGSEKTSEIAVLIPVVED